MLQISNTNPPPAPVGKASVKAIAENSPTFIKYPASH